MNSKLQILNHSVELLIPDRDCAGLRINTSATINLLSNQICELIGGFQKSKKEAGWNNGKGKIIFENVTIIEFSFSDNQLPNVVAIVSNYYFQLSNILNQAEIAVKVDGVFLSTSVCRSGEQYILNYLAPHKNLWVNLGIGRSPST
jgi:hypothetical protein